MQFWLRAIYFPPRDLNAEIKQFDDRYVANLDSHITGKIKSYCTLYNKAADIREYSDAFTGIIMAIHGELLYHDLERAI